MTPTAAPISSPATAPSPDSARVTGGLSRHMLVWGTLGAMVACGAVCAAIAGLINRESLWRGLLAGSTAGTIATALSLVPIALVLNKSFHTLMAGYFLGSAARAIFTFGIAILAIKLGDYPKWETLAFTGAFYFSLLAAEAAILSRMTWTSHVPAN